MLHHLIHYWKSLGFLSIPFPERSRSACLWLCFRMHLQDSRKISTLNVTQGHGNKAVLRLIRGGVIFPLLSAKKFHGPGSTRKEQTEITKALSSLWGVTVLARGFSEQDAFLAASLNQGQHTWPILQSAQRSRVLRWVASTGGRLSWTFIFAPQSTFCLCQFTYYCWASVYSCLGWTWKWHVGWRFSWDNLCIMLVIACGAWYLPRRSTSYLLSFMSFSVLICVFLLWLLWG